jgi:hypothetical protein
MSRRKQRALNKQQMDALQEAGFRFVRDGLGAERVHVDACTRDDLSRIAVVLIFNGEEKEAHREFINAENSHDAEIRAILWAVSLYPGKAVFTDSISAAFQVRNENVHWIPRKLNRCADVKAHIKRNGVPKMSKLIRGGSRTRRYINGGGWPENQRDPSEHDCTGPQGGWMLEP